MDATLDCPVCLQAVPQLRSVTLACSHALCADCAVQWFRGGNDSCPVCRSVDGPRLTWADAKERATAILNRARTARASARLRRRVDTYRRAQEAAKAARDEWRRVQREHAGVLAVARRAKKRATEASWKARGLRWRLGYAELPQDEPLLPRFVTSQFRARQRYVPDF